MKIFVVILLIAVNYNTNAQCDSVATLNKQVLDFAQANLKKKVGRGECWDLAKYALESCNANWDYKFEFGKLLSKADCLMPGDIIQFKGVKIKYKEGKTTYSVTMDQHTAIVNKVISSDEVELIHQNTAYTGKKVGVSMLKFSTIYKGKYMIYRPQS